MIQWSNENQNQSLSLYTNRSEWRSVASLTWSWSSLRKEKQRNGLKPFLPTMAEMMMVMMMMNMKTNNNVKPFGRNKTSSFRLVSFHQTP